MQRSEKGFTLVEIAIVLVIIGLLLGGILKGQEMIVQAKVKNVVADFSGIAAAYHGYFDRYRAIPGDDAGATRWSGATQGNGNGQVLGTYNAATASPEPESRLFWDHLRRAGFVAGSGAAQPTNAFAGMMGVQTGDAGSPTIQPALGSDATGAGGFPGLIFCSANLQDKVAIGLDNQMDDGKLLTGLVRGVLGSTNPAIPANAGTTDFAETGTNLYAMCRAF